MKHILKIESYIVTAEKSLVTLFIALMIAFSFLQLTLRLVFHSGIVWLDPALRHMVLWTGLTGAALASRYSRHFALDALVKFMPESLHRPLAVFIDIFTIVIAGTLFGAAWKFIRDEFASGSVAFFIGNLGIKGGWAGMILPLVFLLAGFHTLLNIFRPKEQMPEAIGHKL
jgi:TRAP-type C4-dicarboxylate transport system permease small subunit